MHSLVIRASSQDLWNSVCIFHGQAQCTKFIKVMLKKYNSIFHKQLSMVKDCITINIMFNSNFILKHYNKFIIIIYNTLKIS